MKEIRLGGPLGSTDVRVGFKSRRGESRADMPPNNGLHQLHESSGVQMVVIAIPNEWKPPEHIPCLPDTDGKASPREGGHR